MADNNYVQKVIFLGNKTFNSKILKKLIFTQEKGLLNELNLINDAHILTQFYQNQGFNNPTIDYEVKSSAQGKFVYFKIYEGDRVKISQINFIGNVNFSALQLSSLLKIKHNDFLIKNKLDDAERTLSDFYKNSGFPFIEIEQKISVNDNKAIVTFLITEGPLTYIKGIKIRGNQKVADWVIYRTLELKSGEKFSLEKIEQARQRLYGTKLFEKVSFYIIDTLKKDSVSIRFDVLEQLPRSIGIGFGIQTPPTRMIFSTEWEHVNFLSRGHNLLLTLSYAPTFSSDWRGEIKGAYRIYYLFTIPLNLLVQPAFKYELRDSIKE
ncbi:MAG: hypothetical protein N2748_01160, partial [candidate division WOR-3 bacterium]|nr:hypothetical protein [candidate division WOR-3 bacterium]